MACKEGVKSFGEIISDSMDEIPAYARPGVIASCEPTKEAAYQLWSILVVDYTRRSLTHRSDVLVATGALAREFANAHGAVLGKYCAGLWENCLREGLLWSVLFNGQDGLPRMSVVQTAEQSDPKEEPKPMQKPSWSWSSCFPPIHLETESEMFLSAVNKEILESEHLKQLFRPKWWCGIVSCEIMHATALDTFGAVESGEFRVRGSLMPLKLAKRDDDSCRRWEFFDSRPDGANLELEAEFKYEREPGMSVSIEQARCIGLMTLSTGFPVLYAGRGRGRGIVLQKVDDVVFRRIGFAFFMIDRDWFSGTDLESQSVITMV